MNAPSRGQKIPDFRSGRHRKTAKSGGKAVEKPGAAFPWLVPCAFDHVRYLLSVIFQAAVGRELPALLTVG
jgi:hypothetical protein